METLRFLDKQNNNQERQNFSFWWKEQVDIYGQEVQYFSSTVTLSSSNFLYGEEPSGGFTDAHKIVALLNINNDALLLSKFGILADSDMAGIIHPYHYTMSFGLSSEPKAGDIMVLSEYGNDRLNYPKRGPNSYQLTEVIDEFQGNPLGGHYVWFFKSKRYDFSYENNSPGSGVGNKPLDDTAAANAASLENFDYPVDNPCDNTSVYGSY